MSAQAHVQKALPPSLLGMVLFISSETMFFGGLFAAYFSLRAAAGVWPPSGVELEILLPGLATLALISSSGTIMLAERKAAAGNRRGTGRWLAITVALGVAFLGAQIYDYGHLGFSVKDGAFQTLFFTMTGFHGAHVAAGLVTFGVIGLRNAQGNISADSHGPLIAAGYYWHFVDVVWILLFATLYLLK
ncbi:MAG: cytochrome c oxidase subunit [Actinomycetota bacterium]|nr:cytochrome c oxidase subunit [Actinomycetota bacterium]